MVQSQAALWPTTLSTVNRVHGTCLVTNCWHRVYFIFIFKKCKHVFLKRLQNQSPQELYGTHTTCALPQPYKMLLASRSGLKGLEESPCWRAKVGLCETLGEANPRLGGRQTQPRESGSSACQGCRLLLCRPPGAPGSPGGQLPRARGHPGTWGSLSAFSVLRFLSYSRNMALPWPLPWRES